MPFKTSELKEDCGLTEDELAQLDAHNRLYSHMVDCYELLISLEYDPRRKELLSGMLADLHEENK